MGVSYERAAHVIEIVRSSNSARYQFVVSPPLGDDTYEIYAKDVEDDHFKGKMYIYRTDRWIEIHSEPWWITNPPVKIAREEFTEEDIERAMETIHGL